MQVLGLDLANGSVKVVGAGCQDVYLNRLQRLYGNEIELTNSKMTVYEYNNERYAVTGKGLTSGGRNSSRYGTKEYLLETLVAINRVAVQDRIFLVCGMPCEDYKNPIKKKELIENIKGSHRIKVNTRYKEIVIEDVHIIPQPLGTLVDFVFNSGCSIQENNDKYRYVVVDIGQGTTDIIATDGLRIEKLAGFNKGCMDIMEMYLDLINKSVAHKDNWKFSRDDFPKHIEPIFEKYDTKHDFSQELHVAKSAVMDMINSEINDCGIDFAHYDRIIFTGGGSKALEQYLPLKYNCKLYPHAQIGNAKGFYKYGLIQRG